MGKKYDILDADKRIEFYKIYEAINDVVGTNYSGWMKACWPNVWGNGEFRLWFPKLAEIKNGEYVSAAFDCVNTISEDGNQIIFDDLKKSQEPGSRKYTGYDLIFAKEPSGGPYLFRGVFVFDADNSRLNHDVSRRIAKRVKLIGDPVTHIEVIYDNETPGEEITLGSVGEDTNNGDDGISKLRKVKKTNDRKNEKKNKKRNISPRTKLKKRITREFSKKKMLGDIQINDEEYDILLDYFRSKYQSMCTTGQRVVVDPVFCIALIQIAIRCYDGAFWPHVKRLLNNPKFNVNHQGWIGTSFAETMKKYNKIQVSYSDRVDSMLMHSFVSDQFAMKFFDFLYAFYRIDLDRDVTRLDRNAMNELVSIIKRNDNTSRTYFIVEHTADAVRNNERGAKTRLRRYLKLIDKAFWGDPLPANSKNRIMQHFLYWKDNDAEFVREFKRSGGKGKRGKKSFATPYINYNWEKDVFSIVLPPQIIRFQDFGDISWIIHSNTMLETISINPYAQGVTGYKTDRSEIEIDQMDIFDEYKISLVEGENKIRSFRIVAESIRFFDEEGDILRNEALPQGIAYSFTRRDFKPESEAVIEYFESNNLLRTAYEFVEGDIIRVPDGKPVSVGGRLKEGILPRGKIKGVAVGEKKDEKYVYSTVPSIFFRMNDKKAKGTALHINDSTYRLSNMYGVVPGVAEFDLKDRSEDKGYLIDLKGFGCDSDGDYRIHIDVPNDRTQRHWEFVLIKNFSYEFEEAPYIFKTRGTLSLPSKIEIEGKGKITCRIEDRKRFDFDIIPGEESIFLDYKGIKIGFEIPTLSYKFHGEEWLTGPHVDIWHTDFDPKLFITYNADKIKIFLNDNGEDDADEHVEVFQKNKSKGLFECDLNRFKSWFGRETVFRQVFMDLPGVKEPVPFVKVVTKSIFHSGLLKADFQKKLLIGEFDITGYSEYYVDVRYKGQDIISKYKLDQHSFSTSADLETGMYDVVVYEAEDDEFGFGEPDYYEIGKLTTELLNPRDLNGMCFEITSIHPIEDTITFLPLYYTYRVVQLCTSDNNIYRGKMMVALKDRIIATFPVIVDFYNIDKLYRVYISFEDEDGDEVEFLYDEYKRIIVKQEDKSLSKSHAYRRYKTSLYPEDFAFDIKFIEPPKELEINIDDKYYNNLKRQSVIENYMGASIFKR